MSNHTRREAIRAYMRDYDVNYTTAQRAVAAVRSAQHVETEQPEPYRIALGADPDGLPVGIEPDRDAHTLLVGHAGRGKTFMASQIAKEVIDRGVDSLVVVSDRPREWDWLPESVTRWNGEGGAASAREILAGVWENMWLRNDTARTAASTGRERWDDRLFVVIDGLASFLPSRPSAPHASPSAGDSEDDVARAAMEETMECIGAVGRSVRAHLVMTAQRPTEVPSSLMRQVGGLVVAGRLGVNDSSLLRLSVDDVGHLSRGWSQRLIRGSDGATRFFHGPDGS